MDEQMLLLKQALELLDAKMDALIKENCEAEERIRQLEQCLAESNTLVRLAVAGGITSTTVIQEVLDKSSKLLVPR